MSQLKNKLQFLLYQQLSDSLIYESEWVEWEAKHRFSIFGIILPNWLSKIIQKICNLVSHILLKCRVQILKNYKDKAKRPLLTFVSMSLIFPISYFLLPSQNSLEVLLDPSKDVMFIMELHKLHKIGKKSTNQQKVVWNFSQLALKNDLGVLQHGLPHSVWIILWKNFKNFLKWSKKAVIGGSRILRFGTI